MEEGPILLWQSEEGFDQLPTHIIPCPLEGDDLRGYYSLSKVAEEQELDLGLWEQELEAQRQSMTHPSLTKRRLDGKGSMRKLSPASMLTRESCQQQFVGFSVLWLGKSATLEIALQPQVAAKFMGFLLAKDVSPSTLTKYCTQLAETVEFVLSDGWPWVLHRDEEWAVQVKGWYRNLRLQCNVMAPPSTPTTITLWQAMEVAQSKWDNFVEAFKVGPTRTTLGQPLLNPPWDVEGGRQAHPPKWDALQENQCQWTRELARECQDGALMLMLVGVNEPPKRIGGLRVLMNSSSLDNTCVLEDCK